VFAKHKVLSVPVWDSDKKEYVGFVDILDLVNITTYMAQFKLIVDQFAKKEVTLDEYAEQERKVLSEETVVDIMSKRN
jgi:hypothetical protein